ncbi:MAG: fucose permease [Paenibacillus sp.]|nr:fucose permease [Paenibacillus sp.]
MGCLSYFIIGLAHVVVGPLMESLIHHYSVDYKDGGQLIMNQFLGFLVGVLAAPSILRVLGRRWTIIIAFSCLTIAETVYSFLPSWGLMLTIGPLAGFGFGMIESVIGAMIISVMKEKKASAMSRLEVFFGIGALVMPGVAAWFILQGWWQISFPFVAILSAVTLLVWFFLPFDGASDQLLAAESNGAESAGEKKVNGSAGSVSPQQRLHKLGYSLRMIPILAAGAFFFFLYVGTEMSIANYLPSIMLKTSGLNESTAAMGVSVFWAAITIGRFVIATVADQIRVTRFLVLTCLGTTIGLILIALNTSMTASSLLSFGLIVLLGLIMAGMFTMGLLFFNDALPGTTERTVSILVACGGLGGAFLPKLTGYIMDRFAAVFSLWLFAGCGFLMFTTVGGAVWIIKRLERTSSRVDTV